MKHFLFIAMLGSVLAYGQTKYTFEHNISTEYGAKKAQFFDIGDGNYLTVSLWKNWDETNSTFYTRVLKKDTYEKVAEASLDIYGFFETELYADLGDTLVYIGGRIRPASVGETPISINKHTGALAKGTTLNKQLFAARLVPHDQCQVYDGFGNRWNLSYSAEGLAYFYVEVSCYVESWQNYEALVAIDKNLNVIKSKTKMWPQSFSRYHFDSEKLTMIRAASNAYELEQPMTVYDLKAGSEKTYRVNRRNHWQGLSYIIPSDQYYLMMFIPWKDPGYLARINRKTEEVDYPAFPKDLASFIQNYYQIDRISLPDQSTLFLAQQDGARNGGTNYECETTLFRVSSEGKSLGQVKLPLMCFTHSAVTKVEFDPYVIGDQIYLSGYVHNDSDVYNYSGLDFYAVNWKSMTVTAKTSLDPKVPPHKYSSDFSFKKKVTLIGGTKPIFAVALHVEDNRLGGTSIFSQTDFVSLDLKTESNVNEALFPVYENGNLLIANSPRKYGLLEQRVYKRTAQ